MFVSCWSAKGGSGTTVTAVALAALLARTHPLGAVLVDTTGDAAAVLGLPDDAAPGLGDWLRAGDVVPADALARLEVPAGCGLALLPPGTAPLADAPPARVEVLARLLAADGRPVVADLGVPSAPAELALAAASDPSLLVVRPCFLALRRAALAPVRPSGVVLVEEPGRALGVAEVEAALGVPVRARVALDPRVAQLVDAGVLAEHLPRPLARALERAA